MTARTLICGIDPGLKGAIAFYNPETKELVHISDVPVKPLVMGTGARRNVVDARALAVVMDIYASDLKFAIVEDVTSMPHDGPVQAFRFGHTAGVIAGVLANFDIPVHFVRPGVWKTLMGLNHEKSNSIRTANVRFPAHRHYFARKKDDGRAEAALLAVFGAERFQVPT